MPNMYYTIMERILMTDDNYDQEQTIKCPYCNAHIVLGINVEYDFDEEGAGAEATLTILNKKSDLLFNSRDEKEIKND